MPLDSVIKRNGFDRCIEFLNESNLIEGIKGIDYRNESFQKLDSGHYGAFILSQQQAYERKPLTKRDICHWQALIAREQFIDGIKLKEHEIGHIRGPNNQTNVRIGKHIPPSYKTVPVWISKLIEDVNESLEKNNVKKLQEIVAYCEFLGDSFHEFERIHPFSDVNGRVGRLIANYIATYCEQPIIVFRSEMIERNRYYEAHDSKEAMQRFMAKKVKEVVFGESGLLFKKEELSGGTVKYESLDGSEKMYYEWHSLNDRFPIVSPV